MTPLQKRFCEEYVIDYHISDAAKRAGYQGDNCRISAWQSLQLPEVQEYVEQLQAEASVRAKITKDQWVAEWVKLGFSNIRNYVTNNHDIKPLDEVKDAEAIKSIKKTVTEFDGGSKTQVEFTLHDKPGALTNIGRHLGFYSEDNAQKNTTLQIMTLDPFDDPTADNSTSENSVT